MVGSAEVPPRDLQLLTDEARLLGQRLRRLVVALSFTDDLVADSYERMASVDDARTTTYRLSAKRARAAADECRAFAMRLEELASDG